MGLGDNFFADPAETAAAAAAVVLVAVMGAARVNVQHIIYTTRGLQVGVPLANSTELRLVRLYLVPGICARQRRHPVVSLAVERSLPTIPTTPTIKLQSICVHG